MFTEHFISVLGFSLSIISIMFSVITFFVTVRHNRKKDTLDAFNKLQSEVFDNLNMIQPKEILEIINQPRSEKYKEISGYVARIEHFCVGVNNNIYDKRTVYALAHGYFDGAQLKDRIIPLIQKKNSNSNFDYYKNIDKVMKWMNNKANK